jgi:exonuclease VII small subunit
VTNVVVQYWQAKILAEEKAHAGFRKQAQEAEDAYYDERSDGLKSKFPIFWANVQIQHAALYSATPRPDVRQRNQAGNVPETVKIKPIAQAIERSLAFRLDAETDDFDGNVDRAVDDFLIAGLGVGWIAYDASVTEDQEGIPNIDLQGVRLEHVAWRDFHWEPGQAWKNCDWIARDHYLTRGEIKKQFRRDPSGEATATDEPGRSTGGGARDQVHEKYATKWRVTEIWHRPTRKIIVIGWGFDAPLEERQDALNLRGFYPCPKPLMANVKSKKFVPKPDYDYYKDQCDYINRLTSRIDKLTTQLKDVGFYDAALDGTDGAFSKLLSAADGQFVPVPNLVERLMAAGGAARFDAVVAKLPLEEKAKVLQILIGLRETAKQVTFEINGIADIVRGNSDPRETAKAQQIKGQYASLRLARRQKALARWIRDAFRIMVEIIGEHFNPEQIFLMSGIALDPQQMEKLRSDVGRTVAIDVETDSTVAADDQADKAQRLEMLNTVGPVLEKMMPAVMQGGMPGDLAKELLLTAVGGFKYGRNLEDIIASLPTTAQQLGQMQQQIQQLQQALQQCQQALQQAQGQLHQVDQREQQREDYKAQTEAQARQAEAQKDGTTAQLNQARTAATVTQMLRPPAPPQGPGGPPRGFR